MKGERSLTTDEVGVEQPQNPLVRNDDHLQIARCARSFELVVYGET